MEVVVGLVAIVGTAAFLQPRSCLTDGNRYYDAFFTKMAELLGPSRFGQTLLLMLHTGRYSPASLNSHAQDGMRLLEHAVVQSVQESLFRYPALFFDDDPVHHRDLPRWTAEAQKRDSDPGPHGFA